jgi:hypothetical protein
VNWIKKNWRRVVVSACGVVGAGALVVPALVPAAAVCAVVTPVLLGGGSALDALKSIVTGTAKK